MAGNTRSIIGYYGGKHRMSQFITDKLDYRESSAYLEMFGGGARVLLNKPRHQREIYVDFGACITTLMRVMSNAEQANEFIHRVYETEHSLEEFQKAKAIVDFVETDPLTYYGNELIKEIKPLLIKYGQISAKADIRQVNKKLLNPSIYESLEQWIKQEGKSERVKEVMDLYQNMLVDYETNGYLKQSQHYDVHKTYTDMEIALATYVVYVQSRDNMGKYWSRDKFQSREAYRRRMDQLYECAERMENVEVLQLDAGLFYKKYMGEGKDTFNKWMESKDLMIYADPSYISPADEKKMLEDVDIENAESLSEEIKKKNEKKPKNLGEVYTASFDYEQQENFVKNIQNAKCKILLSNYDLILYNKYLNEDTGWRKMTFETSTSVGNKAGNRRLECLWYNY